MNSSFLTHVEHKSRSDCVRVIVVQTPADHDCDWLFVHISLTTGWISWIWTNSSSPPYSSSAFGYHGHKQLYYCSHDRSRRRRRWDISLEHTHTWLHNVHTIRGCSACAARPIAEIIAWLLNFEKKDQFISDVHSHSRCRSSSFIYCTLVQTLIDSTYLCRS